MVCEAGYWRSGLQIQLISFRPPNHPAIQPAMQTLFGWKDLPYGPYTNTKLSTHAWYLRGVLCLAFLKQHPTLTRHSTIRSTYFPRGITCLHLACYRAAVIAIGRRIAGERQG